MNLHADLQNLRGNTIIQIRNLIARIGAPSPLAASAGLAGERFLAIPECQAFINDERLCFINTERGLLEDGTQIELNFILSNHLEELLVELDDLALR